MLVHRWMRGYVGGCCRWYVVCTWFVVPNIQRAARIIGQPSAQIYIYFFFIHHHKTTMCLYRCASIVWQKSKKRTDENSRNPSLAVSHPNTESVGRCRLWPLYRVWALRCGIHSNFFRPFWVLRESRLSRVFAKYIKIPNRSPQSTARFVYLNLCIHRDRRMFDHIDFSAIKLW